MSYHNNDATGAADLLQLPNVTADPSTAINNALADSDTVQRLKATFVLGRICSKTGAIDESQIEGLDLVAVVADGTSYSSAAYALSTQLASHVSYAWINTGPDQLNILRVADPYGFATYCLQQIFNRNNHDGDTPRSKSDLCGKYLRNVLICKLRDKLENEITEQMQIMFINNKLTSLISIAKSKTLREVIAKHLPHVTSLQVCYNKLFDLLNRLTLIESELVAKLTKQGMTPTLLRQNREKNGGSSAMAASYSRESSDAKRKWLKYISGYDRSFAQHIMSTLVTSLTADALQMPRDDQAFTDVTVSPTKLAAIKLQIQKKQGSLVFDNILGEFDLTDIAMDLDK